MSFDIDYFLFQILPYLSLGVLILVSILRFDRDPYTWRAKSSQILEHRRLTWGSNLLHVGILVVLVGHVIGLLTPMAVFEFLGISHAAKQVMAIMVGGIAGLVCFAGLVILLDRRLRNARVRATSSLADGAVLWLLLAQLLLGMWSITQSVQHLDGHQMVKLMSWAQYIFTGRSGAAEFVRDAAWVFKLHLVLGMVLFIVTPFTRLVHVWSAPLFYALRRPYQIVRRREV